MKGKIALIQIDVKPRDSQGNLNRALHALESLPEDTDIACLPEMFTTGFDYELMRREAEGLRGRVTEELSRAARDKDLWLVAGSLPERRGENLYNTSILLDSDGEIAGVYRKTHLFPLMNEDTELTPGDDFPVFDTPLGRLGLQICYDLRFPEVTRTLALKGAQIVLSPAQFPHPRLDHWQLLTRTRAVENQIFFGAVNRTGHDENGRFFGHSLLVDPWGETLVEGSEFPGTLLVEADFSRTAEVRTRLPALESRRPELYGELSAP